jgi:hypothetical protein
MVVYGDRMTVQQRDLRQALERFWQAVTRLEYPLDSSDRVLAELELQLAWDDYAAAHPERGASTFASLPG